METNFEELVSALNISPDVLQPITLLLKQQTTDSLPSFISQSFQSVLTLERWVWQLLSYDSHQWIEEPDHQELFHTLASFNKQLIFIQENIDDDNKVSLLIPESIDQMNSIFEQVERSTDDNDSFIHIVNLWLDNLSFCVHEYPQLGHSPIITHINQYIGHHFLMNEQFKLFLLHLRRPQTTQTIFTAKQYFYMKTCPFSLNVYFYTNPQNFDYTANQVLQNIGDDYLQIIRVHSCTIELWSKELLTCITHLIGFMRAFLWWNGENGDKLKILLPTEELLCEYIESIIRIIDYRPFYKSIMGQWFNDETRLMDASLLFLVNIVQTQNISWFFRSMTQLPDTLLAVAESSVYYRIYLSAYGILSEILTDEHVKQLKIIDSIRIFFFTMLEQAWHHPSKKYKQIPISYFLRGFLNVSKNDFLQQQIAQNNKISLFIEMCDQYPIVFDIIWALSFNPIIQQQLRSSASFMSKLVHREKDCDNEQMRKTTHGILWNLEINHDARSTSEINDTQTFDIMISYSHKEKILSKQLYDELIRFGYRVWIDFDQMHGNVMDAMAKAIERSQTVIICMSEQYRASNYCRAEAHYAFQRQRKIVPVLLQKHYKPDAWLLFLVGQLLYVDFIKYEFPRAMEMLMKELKAEDIPEISAPPVCPTEEIDVAHPIPPLSSALPITQHNILEWTKTQVQDWLVGHNLIQMSHLLVDCDGRSLVYFNKYIKHGQPQQILTLLQDDSLRRTNQNISLIELSCFHSLMDQQKRLVRN